MKKQADLSILSQKEKIECVKVYFKFSNPLLDENQKKLLDECEKMVKIFDDVLGKNKNLKIMSKKIRSKILGLKKDYGEMIAEVHKLYTEALEKRKSV